MLFIEKPLDNMIISPTNFVVVEVLCETRGLSHVASRLDERTRLFRNSTGREKKKENQAERGEGGKCNFAAPFEMRRLSQPY